MHVRQWMTKPVIDEDKLVGIVTRSDLLDALLAGEK